MVQILRFRTTWGILPGSNYDEWRAWFPTLKRQGYAGVEVDFTGLSDLPTIRKICDDAGLEISVLIHTAWGGYVGPRPTGLTPQVVLGYYREQLQKAQVLRPINYNAQSGSDHWTLDESVEFYKGTLEVDVELGLEGKIRHETHRLRSMFNPYAGIYVLSRVPKLRITADISHWVVVCERLLDQGEEDKAILKAIIPHVSHIHARMGTTQSSQCPDPTNEVFTPERIFFENFWKECIKAQKHNDIITFVPEYGPYPYHPFGSARTFSEVADTEGARLQVLFEEWAKE
ncbi:hypothetical protein B0J13DRAFT_607626 [Dactylonectria estremocensis]|uniref:Xylose isomerase-like TIM barrel domain-containing protein n=1 Tax=Dactylonectria estremocensis TaxID=1079267 RepID=A0A9P9EUN7_9HYPO|nr:hypothetical protein B0J13DRAFT_607626 [Dactylonectria estremocensis]